MRPNVGQAECLTVLFRASLPVPWKERMLTRSAPMTCIPYTAHNNSYGCLRFACVCGHMCALCPSQLKKTTTHKLLKVSYTGPGNINSIRLFLFV